MTATYTSVFDHTITCTSPCQYDPDTKTAHDFDAADNAHEADDANALTDEYVTLPDGTTLREHDGVTFDY